MSRLATLLMLGVAALLEAGGDAFIRRALDRGGWAARVPLFLAGALTLFVYGVAVNAPRWNFGRLLGLYAACFFLAAQVISWLILNQRPPLNTLLGGALIVAGGLVIAFGP